MPAPRRISIGFLMAVVGLIAADFAIVRGLWNDPARAMVAVVTLPMVNILILAAPGLRRAHPGRPYWLGFVVVGGLVTLLAGLACAALPETFFLPFAPLRPVFERLAENLRPMLGIALTVLIYTPTLLLPAVVAGKLSARYRLVIERR